MRVLKTGPAKAIAVVAAITALAIRCAVARAQVAPEIAPCSRFVATTGSNDASGRTESEPYRSIGHALARLGTDGGTVCIEDGGPYPEAVTIGHSGKPGRWLAIRGIGKERAIIAPRGKDRFAINVNGKSYVAIERVHTRGGLLGIVTSGGGGHWYVGDNEIEDAGGSGIQLNDGDYVTIVGNLVHGNAATWKNNGSGISIFEPRQIGAAPGNHIYIAANTLYRNWNPPGGTDGNAIILDTFSTTGYSAASLVENNLAYGNGGACIKVNRNFGARTLIRNNTCYKNQQLASKYTWRGEVSLEYSGNVSVVNNILWFDPDADRSNSGFLDGGTIAPGNFALSNIIFNGLKGTNPMLANPPVDFQPRIGSPAVGKGTTVFGSPASDIAGAPRDGSRVDIGAFGGASRVMMRRR